ncbi:MAG: DUF3784 domain-containing protein [Clostridia bacterium]|nr:DUF3784 domain-containing protein [Clostridia bacterium]
MLVLKIVALVLGAAFTGFGYFICFRGKYFLINGFEEDLREGRKTEAYPKKVGLIEFVIGIVCLLAGAALVFFA